MGLQEQAPNTIEMVGGDEVQGQQAGSIVKTGLQIRTRSKVVAKELCRVNSHCCFAFQTDELRRQVQCTLAQTLAMEAKRTTTEGH